MKITTRFGVLAGCALLATGATLTPLASAASTTRPPHDAFGETDLYFGTARPGGGPAVTPQEFQHFLDTQVTPAFPDGLTVEEGRGQYRDRFGVIEKERSYRVILLYPAGSARSADVKIDRIRRLYEKDFQQESVGRVDEATHASFD